MEPVIKIKPSLSNIFSLLPTLLGLLVFAILGYFLRNMPFFIGWLSLIFFGGGFVLMTGMLIINFIYPTLQLDKIGMIPGFIDLRYFSSNARKKILWEDVEKISVGKSEVITNISNWSRYLPWKKSTTTSTSSNFDYLTIFLKYPEKYNLPDSPQMYNKEKEAALSMQGIAVNSVAKFNNMGHLNISGMLLPRKDLQRIIEAFKKYPVKIEGHNDF